MTRVLSPSISSAICPILSTVEQSTITTSGFFALRLFIDMIREQWFILLDLFALKGSGIDEMHIRQTWRKAVSPWQSASEYSPPSGGDMATTTALDALCIEVEYCRLYFRVGKHSNSLRQFRRQLQGEGAGVSCVQQRHGR